MRIITTQVTTPEDTAAMFAIRREVFESELGIRLAPVLPSANGRVTYFLARYGPDQVPVGCLWVLDTTNNHELHDELGLKFDRQTRVARFTHLAVLKPYRGMNIPLSMMLEAYRSVIVPREFDYTWLLFDVKRASRSFLAQQLGFTLMPQTFDSEYGCRCPLVRNERAPKSANVIRLAQEYLDHRASFYAPEGTPSMVRVVAG